jgi:hypothetical protein
MCTHNKLATVPEGRRWLHCQKVGCSGNGKHQPSANPIPEFEIFHMFMLFNMVQSCSKWFKIAILGNLGTKVEKKSQFHKNLVCF